jgi:hypothetical protein
MRILGNSVVAADVSAGDDEELGHTGDVPFQAASDRFKQR